MNNNILKISTFLTLILISGCQISGTSLQGNLTNPQFQSETQSHQQPDPSLSPEPIESTQTSSTIKSPKIALVSINNDFESQTTFGCGDSIVEVTPKNPHSTFSESSNEQSKLESLKSTLNYLFSHTEPNYFDTGLYNTFYQSKLQVSNIEITSNSTVKINLSGTLTLSGVCDKPRVIEQLNKTAAQFFPNSNFEFNLNEKPISSVF